MNTIIHETLQTDVLVVGGGAAGLRAAVEASNQGVEVIVAIKGKKFTTGSSFYPAVNTLGFQACMPDESFGTIEDHEKEILKVGEGMADPMLAGILAAEAYQGIKPLTQARDLLYKVEPEMDLQKPCFSEYYRSWLLVSMRSFRDYFSQKVLQNKISVLERIYIFSLLVENNECYGVLGLTRDEKLIIIESRAVILASGGGASLYKHNLNTKELIGDGYIMALEAGAELFNIEFIQFIYSMCSPRKKFIFHQGLFSHGTKLYDLNGKEFIHERIPKYIDYEKVMATRSNHGPFTSRLISKYIDIAVFKEIISRNEIGRGVYAKCSELEKCQKESNFSDWMDFLGNQGYKLNSNNLEITLSAHAFNGGVRIDENAKTRVNGLFAAGEIAAGPHGADRLGGNMMTATQVFGARAGKNAAEFSKTHTRIKINTRKKNNIFDIMNIDRNESNHLSINKTKNIIMNLMWENAGICRNEKGLIHASKIIKGFDNNQVVCGRKELWDYFTLKNMIKLSGLILKSALMRRESRGNHYREDFPEKNNCNFRKPIFVFKEKENIVHEFREMNW